MKRIIPVALLLILLFLCCMLACGYIQNTAEEMKQMLTETEQLIRTGSRDEAYRSAEALEIRWETISARWKTLMDHEDIRDIEISMADLRTAILHGEKQEAEAEAAALRDALTHVQENEKTAFYNIL